MTHPRNTSTIQQLALAKSQQARQRVLAAIEMLRDQGKPVNFGTVSKAAEVSKTFLYDPKHADLAQLIRRHRETPIKGGGKSGQPGKSEPAKDAQLTRLKERVQALEKRVAELERENQLMYGKLADRSTG
jgi:hypothetical protein